jgi:hypothetical protein
LPVPRKIATRDSVSRISSGSLREFKTEGYCHFGEEERKDHRGCTNPARPKAFLNQQSVLPARGKGARLRARPPRASQANVSRPSVQLLRGDSSLHHTQVRKNKVTLRSPPGLVHCDLHSQMLFHCSDGKNMMVAAMCLHEF